MTTKLTVSRRLLMSILALIACVVFSLVVLWWWREQSITTQSDPLASTHLTVRSPSSIRRAQQPIVSRLSFLSNTNQPYQARLIQLRQISTDGISEPELQQLYELLQSPPSKGELPEHWFVIANDIFALLLTHETRPQRLSKQFLEILNHPQQPDVMRDYAVQHLCAWLHPRSRQAQQTQVPAPNAEQSQEVLQALAKAATDPSLEQTSIPGTTLMMLADLARSSPEVDCQGAVNVLTPWLRQALQEGSSLSHPIRVSAVTAAGILAPQEFRPIIRQIAYQDLADASLRLPAIAALGQMGEQQDLLSLQAIAQSSPALHYAALEAMTALTRRFPDSAANRSNQ